MQSIIAHKKVCQYNFKINKKTSKMNHLPPKEMGLPFCFVLFFKMALLHHDGVLKVPIFKSPAGLYTGVATLGRTTLLRRKHALQQN